MKRYFPFLCLLLYAYAEPLLSMDESAKQSQTSEQILAQLRSNNNPAFAPIREAVEQLAETMAELGQIKPTHAPAPAAPPTPRPARMSGLSLDSDPSFDFSPYEEGAQKIMANIQKIHDLSKQLNDEMMPYSAQCTQQDLVLTDDERHVLQHLESVTEQALNNDRYISTALGLGVSTGASILLWIVSIDPIAVYRAYQIRFPGLDIAMLATIKSLLGPIVCIICIAAAWYHFKQWIIEPYQKKHAEDIAKLRAEVEAHKKQTQQAYDQSQRQNVATRSDLMQALDGTKGHLEHEIKALHAQQSANQQGLENISRNFGVLLTEKEKQILRQIEERHRAALIIVDERIQKLKVVLDREEKERSALVHAFNDQVEEDLDRLKDSVKTLKETNLQMKATLDTAIVEVGQTKDTMATLKDQSQQLLDTVRAAVRPRNTVASSAGAASSSIGLFLPPTASSTPATPTERKRK